MLILVLEIFFSWLGYIADSYSDARGATVFISELHPGSKIKALRNLGLYLVVYFVLLMNLAHSALHYP